MDSERLSPAVQRAIFEAQLLASKSLASTAQPRHIVEALLGGEPEGQAAAAARSAGLAISDYLIHRRTVGNDLNKPNSNLTPNMLDEALILARQSTPDRIVTGDALLLAALRVDEALAAELARFGLNRDLLEQQLLGPSHEPLPMTEPMNLEAPTEWAIADRVLDANANRAREALRVLEEYARFGIEDRYLSRTLKQLRHDLADLLDEMGVGQCIASRDTAGDVGTRIALKSEAVRESLIDLVAANSKRLQESLRSLEEYGKLRTPTVAVKFEQMRYRTYSAERALAVGDAARSQLAGAKLYLMLTGATTRAALDWTIAEAAAGGVGIVQLREKELPDRLLLERAKKMRQWTRKAGVLFIVNDRPDIARLSEADGVHLGQDDMPVREARRILGPRPLVGVSTHTIDQVRQAVMDGAGYIGIGPTFPSTTKSFKEFPGIEFVRAAMSETTLPAFVLGGITPENVSHVVAAGACRVAVGAAIAASDSPQCAARRIREQIND